jgi:hypothetical protein
MDRKQDVTCGNVGIHASRSIRKRNVSLTPEHAAKTMEWSALALLRQALADGPPVVD